jgi:hypothetical protein
VGELALTFSWTKPEGGGEEEELVPGGKDKAVTEENKVRRVHGPCPT